ncbi:unnamed protein product [Spirodela intermedia]|uniref:Uncharacterized protein n=1 Tax=Spirodela intermedia TaxID=51605 RepID=A0A7I8IH68_SPIIN|nr:unnamed protein product [Spirodela intermedia]CAA6656644.1 unnamed protein product [Spirodela intermedia]
MIAQQIAAALPVSGDFHGGPPSIRLLPAGPSFCSNPCRRARLFRSKSQYFFGSGSEKIWAAAKGRRKESLVVPQANQGFNFNGGGGGGWDKNNTARVLGNLAVAIGLTYLTVTGQLGWLLDAIVSIWLLAVLLPILGLGAFFWFAGQDIIQDSCPNCGNEFQIFKSSLKDGVQFCPFCAQPISVQGNKFVMESARFSSNRSSKFSEASRGSSRRSEKGKGSSAVIVDIEAEVMDAD